MLWCRERRRGRWQIDSLDIVVFGRRLAVSRSHPLRRHFVVDRMPGSCRGFADQNWLRGNWEWAVSENCRWRRHNAKSGVDLVGCTPAANTTACVVAVLERTASSVARTEVYTYCILDIHRATGAVAGAAEAEAGAYSSPEESQYGVPVVVCADSQTVDAGDTGKAVAVAAIDAAGYIRMAAGHCFGSEMGLAAAHATDAEAQMLANSS